MSKSVNSDALPRPTTGSLFPAADQPREGGDVGLRAAERRRIAAERPSGGGGDFGGVAFEAFEGQVGLLFRGAIERLCAANRFPFSVPFIRQGSLQI